MPYTPTMTLAGTSLGSNFPIYSKTFEYIRADDQAPAIKKVHVTIAGFLEGADNAGVMALYQLLKANVDPSNVVFNYTYTDGVTPIVVHNNQKCWIESYNEPADSEYAKAAVGDYSIGLYWFEDCAEGLALACTYVTSSGTYTFPKTPKWGRKITPNRDSYRSNLYGSSAQITLEGTLKAADHSALKTMVDAITSAFSKDGVLSYGDFSQSVRIVDADIQPATLHCYCVYRITLGYDIGSIVKLSRKVHVSRVHANPVITEQPYCETRLIEFMNSSGQTITYTVSITASDISTARSLLASEVAATVIFASDMIEMPGGGESWDYDNCKVDINIIKFYPTVVVPNMFGTG